MRQAAVFIGLALIAGGVSAGASGAPSTAGLAGRVVAGPTCPVERVPPDPRCAPMPLAARLWIDRVGDHRASRVVRSGRDGRFLVRLAPATYVVRALAQNGSPFPRPPAPFRVRVRGGRLTYVRIIYDTGIR